MTKASVIDGGSGARHAIADLGGDVFWWLCACAPELEVPTPADLPDQVRFRTATESFNPWWYFAVRGGRIWVKPNEETGLRRAGDWELLGRTGLPEGGSLVRFGLPDEVTEISADGAHIHAISADGHFYRGADARTDVRDQLHWTDRWGWPAARGPGLSTSWSTERGWSVSDASPFQVGHTEDSNGERHSVGLGVAHVYRLTEDGREVAFNDWWLPADWSRRVCGPERGTAEAVAISASASTLLLLGRDGALWTRRYDFDTGGENDLLRYSYVVDGPDGRTRRLPAEDWSRQPDPPAGRLTNHVAIAQDGKGDAARILRVEAERDGEAGYWEKPIEGAEWSWQAMDGAVGGAFLDTLPASSPAAAPEDVAVVGVLAREDVESDVMLELLDFNLVCSPARARLRRGGADIRVDGAPVELTFHHVPTTVEEVRPDDALDQDVPIPVRAALVLDLDWIFVDDPGDRDALIALFGEREVVNFIGTATRTRLELGEIPLFMAARVPAREKGHKGELFSLTAAVAAP